MTREEEELEDFEFWDLHYREGSPRAIFWYKVIEVCGWVAVCLMFGLLVRATLIYTL